MNKAKYIIVNPEEMNSYYEQGYEFLGIISETEYKQTQNNNNNSYYQNYYPQEMRFTGMFMGNEISLIGNFANKSKILMGLSKTQEILFGRNVRHNEQV